MKRGPLIAFGAPCAALCAVPYFVSETAWTRGVGDEVIIVAGLIILILIAWERRIRSS